MTDDTENVERLLTSWGAYLSPRFDLEAFGSTDLPPAAKKYYTRIAIPENEPPRFLRGNSFATMFSKVATVHRQCTEYIEQRSPDVVIQLWSFNSHAAGVASAGRRCGVPTVVRYSGPTFDAYKFHHGFERAGVFALNNCLNRFVSLKFADKVVTLGPNGSDAIKSRGVGDEDIVLLPPTLDSEGRFHPVPDDGSIRQRLGLPEDRRIALYVGRLTELKGMPFLERVIASLEDRTDVQFVLIGEGPYREKLNERFDDRTVMTPGHVSYEEIDQYYKAADLYVHPSPKEGLPLVILESMECGVPVVARRAGDIGFVTDNIVDSVEEMVSVIRNEAWDEEWRNDRYFESEFQRNKLTDMIEDVTR
ncbi:MULTISPECIES: glycosyltransferase family 4 protein [unclassified Haladaptatus]|uniref:glycosyltransferase family 4 protein n=1 Tax=unclassified Haladaptatus TaxID=2622732 RepID=UPI00209BC332|nr:MULTISPECIES: glycosyltransferase family 4 protein [unclassified Haladaptatus]MCO8255721.1 glycosyltransferase family 4 protein [Haladaptatus sp. AB618]